MGGSAGLLRGGRIALLALGVAVASPCSAHAQQGAPSGFAVLKGRELVFGPVIPGVPERVSVLDAGRRAELIVEGAGVVELMLRLPSDLTSPEGGRIPLRFAPGDAAILAPGSVEAMPFDPSRVITLSLDPARGPTRILIGGTALATEAGIGGVYSAVISVAVVQSGS